MRIKQLGGRAFAQNDLDPRPPKQLFLLIQAGPIIEIAQYNQVVTSLQVLLDPASQPNSLGQLLATIFNRNPYRFRIITGAVGRLGFGMHTNQTQLTSGRG